MGARHTGLLEATPCLTKLLSGMGESMLGVWRHFSWCGGATHKKSLVFMFVFFLAQTKMSWRSLLTSQYSR